MGEFTSFSVRIPQNLEQVITQRAKLLHRSRNSQIIFLLEQALQQEHERNLEAIKDHEERLSQIERRQLSQAAS